LRVPFSFVNIKNHKEPSKCGVSGITGIFLNAKNSRVENAEGAGAKTTTLISTLLVFYGVLLS